jgi:uncharacterized membrane protein YjjP (DUF1212 family)
LLRLARALHVYGTPAHRLEEALASIADLLGVEAKFMVSPTSIMASFGSLDQQRMRMLRVDAGETDLGKLAALHEVIGEVVEGSLGAAQARDRVEAITEAGSRFPRWAVVLGFALSSASVARIFEGGWAELAASGALGLVIGSLAVVAGPNPRVRQLVPAVAGLVAAGAAAALAAMVGLYPPIVVLSSLIVLVPGLTMTAAMNELASGHVVSGTARLSSALVTFLQLGFGVALGTKLASTVATQIATSEPASLPDWTLPVAVIPMAASLVMLFQARWRDLGLILPVLIVSYVGTRLGSLWLGPELGAALGALALGISSNALARWRDVPTAIPLVPGLLPLVPGSLGLTSLQSILANDVMTGVETASGVALIAVGLVSGLFLANLVVTPRRLL